MAAGKEVEVEKRALPLPLDKVEKRPLPPTLNPEYYSLVAECLGKQQAEELKYLLRLLRLKVTAISAENGKTPPLDEVVRQVRSMNVGVGFALNSPSAPMALRELQPVKDSDKFMILHGYLVTVLHVLGASELAIWALQKISDLTSEPIEAVIFRYAPLIAWIRSKLPAESSLRLDTNMGLLDFKFNRKTGVHEHRPKRNPSEGS